MRLEIRCATPNPNDVSIHIDGMRQEGITKLEMVMTPDEPLTVRLESIVTELTVEAEIWERLFTSTPPELNQVVGTLAIRESAGNDEVPSNSADRGYEEREARDVDGTVHRYRVDSRGV
jgi:hypothetical protein